MLVDYVKIVNAKQSFKIKEGFEFLNFDDITPEMMTDENTFPDQIEIFTAVKLSYEGKLPDSYKTINLIIGDWIESHTKELTKVIHQKLKGHFKELYPNSNLSDLEGTEETSIWEDQLEYMPRINEDKKTIIIEIELVLDAEPEDTN